MSDETVIKKIPLDKLIAALVSLYNGGVDCCAPSQLQCE